MIDECNIRAEIVDHLVDIAYDICKRKEQEELRQLVIGGIGDCFAKRDFTGVSLTESVFEGLGRFTRDGLVEIFQKYWVMGYSEGAYRVAQFEDGRKSPDSPFSRISEDDFAKFKEHHEKLKTNYARIDTVVKNILDNVTGDDFQNAVNNEIKNEYVSPEEYVSSMIALEISHNSSWFWIERARATIGWEVVDGYALDKLQKVKSKFAVVFANQVHKPMAEQIFHN